MGRSEEMRGECGKRREGRERGMWEVGSGERVVSRCARPGTVAMAATDGARAGQEQGDAGSDQKKKQVRQRVAMAGLAAAMKKMKKKMVKMMKKKMEKTMKMMKNTKQ